MPRQPNKAKRPKTGPTEPEPGLDVEVRGKTRTKRVRGRRGLLQGLDEMPLDILFEIFSLLRPLDLLRLARTTKAFRGLLMSRSSAPIWRTSRQQIEGLPPCPVYLSEPAYANLAFGSYCHNCPATGVYQAIPEFRARYCAKCRKWMVYLKEHVRLDEEVLKTLPRVAGRDMAGGDYGAFYFHCPETKAIAMSLGNAKSKSEKLKILQDQKALTAMIETHAKLFRQWADTLLRQREEELYEIRERRVAAIVVRLKDLGWEQELQHMGPDPSSVLFDLSVVRQPKELTERTWANMRQKVVDFMEDRKAHRLRLQHADVLVSRFRIMESAVASFLGKVSPTDFVPCLVDVCRLPEVRALVDVPDTTQLTAEDFRPLQPLLSSIFSDWKTRIQSLYDHYISSMKTTPNTFSPSDLATSVFECSDCHHILFPPDVFDHSCLNRKIWCLPSTHGDCSYDIATENFTERRPWSIDVIGKPSQRGQCNNVVMACGRDPKETTSIEMDGLDPRLECTRCTSFGPGVMEVMTWRDAMRHALQMKCDIFAKRRVECTFVAVDHTVASLAKGVKQKPYPLGTQGPRWCCALCSIHRNEAKREVLDHLLSAHEIHETPEEHCYYNPEVFPPLLPVTVVPQGVSPEALSGVQRDGLSTGHTLYH